MISPVNASLVIMKMELTILAEVVGIWRQDV